jgi:hypothetical protein
LYPDHRAQTRSVGAAMGRNRVNSKCLSPADHESAFPRSLALLSRFHECLLGLSVVCGPSLSLPVLTATLEKHWLRFDLRALLRPWSNSGHEILSAPVHSPVHGRTLGTDPVECAREVRLTRRARSKGVGPSSSMLRHLVAACSPRAFPRCQPLPGCRSPSAPFSRP